LKDLATYIESLNPPPGGQSHHHWWFNERYLKI